MRAVIGVDVGTGSARAAVLDERGAFLARATRDIRINRPRDDFVEQSGEDIWAAVCAAVREAMAEAKLAAEAVVGLAFDAACSLVLRDAAGAPLSISSDGAPEWDTIVWMDHRAKAEAEQATATGSPVLDYVGGIMSPEMQTPKLAWIKRHLPDTWARMAHAFDLSDFLAWKATGQTARSSCTLTCKWTYVPGAAEPWDKAYLAAMGLGDFHARTGTPARATPIGAPVGKLSAAGAAALGLTPACTVAAGLIDAHAGALGTLGPCLDKEIEHHLALIAGTSNCHMALSAEPHPTPGVWGPYRDAVAPGYWLAEGGQSAAGALLDHLIAQSSAATRLGDRPHDALAEILAPRLDATPDLAPQLHVLPDFHGNRSPYADPHATGLITGLTLADPLEQLVQTYWAAAASIAYETRQIIEALNAQGFAIDTIHLSGGAVRNPVLTRLYAEATGAAALTLPASPDPVLLGAAIAAAVGAGLHADLASAAKTMTPAPRHITPAPTARAAHQQRYARYVDLLTFQRAFHQRIQGRIRQGA